MSSMVETLYLKNVHCKLLLRKLGETSSAHLHLQQVEFFRFSPAKVYKRTHIIESRWFLLHQHPLWEDSHTQATFSSHRYEMALEPLRSNLLVRVCRSTVAKACFSID